MDIQGKNLEGEAGKDHGRAVSGDRNGGVPKAALMIIPATQRALVAMIIGDRDAADEILARMPVAHLRRATDAIRTLQFRANAALSRKELALAEKRAARIFERAADVFEE